MPFNPAKYHRHSIRLPGYDYSRPSAYFVTICVQNRECLFGEIIDNRICLNVAGAMVEKWCLELPNKFPHIQIDEHITMPNHFHSIIIIAPPTVVGADLRVCPSFGVCPSCVDDKTMAERMDSKGEHTGSPLQFPNTGVVPEPAGSPLREPQPIQQKNRNLPAIMQWFKTMTTNEYVRNVKTNGWRAFPGKLWQRNYYDHIGRDENELHRIRQYIRDNPLCWDTDEENPLCKSPRYVAMPNPQRQYS